MREVLKTKIDEEFKPSPQLKKLYFIYLVLIIFVGILSWYIPVLITAPFVITLIFSVPVLFVLVFTVYWIPKYYDSISYKLTEEEVVWKRGVWFRKTGIVPYNRIANIDIAQGPISRMFGIAVLRIHTAGYSAPSGGGGSLAEIKIEGMKQFEELRDLIMEFVRGKRPAAVETYGKDFDARILDELVKIRKLLEKSSAR